MRAIGRGGVLKREAMSGEDGIIRDDSISNSGCGGMSKVKYSELETVNTNYIYFSKRVTYS